MTAIKQPLLSPIRFYDPSMEFDNETNFQNPDNRVSTGYDWENVNPIQYALPIPKVWPDGQPGIDTLVMLLGASDVNEIYADLYDSDDEYYASLYCELWMLSGSGPMDMTYRLWLNGNDGSGIEDGNYTIKIFDESTDEVILESESLLIADWFEDCIPFEFWNFENDFGMYWISGELRFTTRLMVPIRLYDPVPEFEKTVYKDDPGMLTTLRSTMQRVFNFDSLPVPVHVAELVQMGFACSELYLDRIKINTEEVPDAENYEGTNLKYMTGKATFVDFNEAYHREAVNTEEEETDVDWATSSYTGSIVANLLTANENPVVVAVAESDSYSVDAEDMVIVKILLTDTAGDSDLPEIKVDGYTSYKRAKAWGYTSIALRVTADGSFTVLVQNDAGEKAVFTAELSVVKIVQDLN